MRVVRTLDEALADCVVVVMTSGGPSRRAAAGGRGAAPALLAGHVALVFGDEVRGLTNRELQRYAVAGRDHSDRGEGVAEPRAGGGGVRVRTAQGARRGCGFAAPPEPLADERSLRSCGNGRATLLLAAGFLNPQQPDRVLDELVSLVRRS